MPRLGRSSTGKRSSARKSSSTESSGGTLRKKTIREESSTEDVELTPKRSKIGLIIGASLLLLGIILAVAGIALYIKEVRNKDDASSAKKNASFGLLGFGCLFVMISMGVLAFSFMKKPRK